MHLWRNWQFSAERRLRRKKRELKRRRGRNFAPLQGAKNFGHRKSHAKVSEFLKFFRSYLFLFELTHSLTAVCIYCGLSETLRLGSPLRVKFRGQKLNHAPVAELADAYGSGPYFWKKVQVRFLSGAPQRCVTVDTNGYAPLFFPIGKALKINRFWQQGVQIERLSARIFLLFGEIHIWLWFQMNPLKRNNLIVRGKIWKWRGII